MNDKACQQASFTPNVVFESFDSNVRSLLVRTGVGVALLPEICWRSDVPAQLIKLLIDHEAMQRSILLSWMDNRYLSPAARDFCGFVGEYAATQAQS
ncbi:hypothetical protein JYB87_05325 [Shewanella avicenniae]|uniref:LysR substrate-binding domain-containing protein n=1 Tax=Shewanella avicenniae TaxID=2814294 RepID=A0ABX7QV94_9GAMM|nr:hypothetical protein JYB87_05325 [Shewanella avicenniae]